MNNNYNSSVMRSRHNRQLLFQRRSDIIFIFVFLVVIMIVSTILDSKFLTIGNLNNMLRVWACVIVATYAQSFIMISMAGVDLSISGVIALVNCVCARLMTESNPGGWLWPVLVALAIGVGIGLLNGVLVTKGKQQPIIITLATNTILMGLALFVMPQPGGFVNNVFSKFMIRGIGGFAPLIITVIITVLCWLLLNRTSFGRSVYAVGGNEIAAYSSGIKVDRVKILAFVISGVLSAIAGLFLTALTSSGDATGASQFATRTITAAVVGGISLMGGRGSIIGCIAGVFILAIINNILNLVGIPSFYQYVLQGAILIFALAFAAIRDRNS